MFIWGFKRGDDIHMGLTAYDIQNITMIRHSHSIPGLPLTVSKIDNSWEGRNIPHWHNEFDFIYQSKGSMIFKVGSKTIKLLEGQAILVNIGEFQWAAPSGEGHSIFYRIIINPALLVFGDANDPCQLKYIKPLINKEYRIPSHISGSLAWEKEILTQITRIIGMFYSNQQGFEIDIRASVYRIFGELVTNMQLRKITKKELLLNEDKATRLSVALNYIYDNLGKKISINEIAAQVKMSPYNFMHFFKNIISMPPIQYINYYRIKKACKILSTTDSKILDVAMETGFENLSYFNKIFRKYKKCTPTEYKALHNISSVRELPDVWKNADVGTVGVPGSSKYNGCLYIISGSGDDIWEQDDLFQFAYIKVKGDCSISARVNSVQNTDKWAKAGVMIRSTLDSSSVFADCVITPLNGGVFQWRDEHKEYAKTTNGINSMKVPIYLKVLRQKNNFSAYYSKNGADWVQIGDAVSIKTNKSVYLGLVVSSHSPEMLCTATFDNINIESPQV